MTKGETQDLTLGHDAYKKTVTSVPLAPDTHTTLVGDVRNIGLMGVSFTVDVSYGWAMNDTQPI